MGIGSSDTVIGSAVFYTMSDKLVDIEWLTPLGCNLLLKLEFHRMGKDMAVVLNTSSRMGMEAMKARGKFDKCVKLSIKVHL
jgi:hypothetical protein